MQPSNFLSDSIRGQNNSKLIAPVVAVEYILCKDARLQHSIYGGKRLHADKL